MKYVKDEEKRLMLDKFLVDVNLKYADCQKEIDALVDNLNTLFTLSQEWKLSNKQLWTSLGAAIGNSDSAFKKLYDYIAQREQKKNVSETISTPLKNIRSLLYSDQPNKELGVLIKSLVRSYSENIIDRLETEAEVKSIIAVGHQEWKKARHGVDWDPDAGYKLAQKLHHEQQERKNFRQGGI